ncbi:MAG: hypothetical protein AB2A00_25935 [Myxococcota bacterium]
MLSLLRRGGWLRLVTLVLAWAHSFPAAKHLGLFVDNPSLTEAWKGFGALAAVVIYLLPVPWLVGRIQVLWQRRRVVVQLATTVLVVAHLVPAVDHLPRFWAEPGWSEGWRGVGSLLAATWLALPVDWQGRVLQWVLRPRVGTRVVEEVVP